MDSGMKKANVSQLIPSLEKKLLPKFHDETLCTQYAWWLIQAITGKDETQLIADGEVKWDVAEQKKFDEALDALTNKHMPLQYLLGSTPFAGLEILTQPPVLIPRPETEEWTIKLIEQLQSVPDKKLTILDLCTGSGCIALALAEALPQAKVYGTDISDIALALAEQNKLHNHISNATFLRSDLFAQIPKEFTFDLIVGNPPYIDEKDWLQLDKSVTQWEDKHALIAADHGLALIKKIIDNAPKYLKKNETLKQKNIPQLILEIDYTQGKAVKEYLEKADYNQIAIYKDLEGKDRVASGRIDNVAIAAHS